MDDAKKKRLIEAGVDIEGAMERFMGNEPLYDNFLQKFTANPTFDELEQLIADNDWEQALTAAHNLKGITGGLGFTRLYELLCSQVALMRQNDFDGAARIIGDIMAEYHRLFKIVEEIT